MKSFNVSWKTGMILLFLLLISSACEYDGPNSPWEQAKQAESVIPVITQVIPEDASGASVITINGKNFSANPEEVWVYVEKEQCKVIECSETSISIYRPKTVGDALTISVVIKNAATIAKYSPYKLAAVVNTFGYFADTDIIVTIAMDANENMYVTMNDGSIRKLDPTSQQPDEAYLADMSPLATDMKIGPDGGLYFVRKKATVYRIPPEGGSAENYAKFDKVKNKEAKAAFFDFDQNKNIFAGGTSTGLLLLRADLTQANWGIYNEYDITAVRVFNEHVYVAAEYLGSEANIPAKAIWKNEIISTSGEVNPVSELVLDLAKLSDSLDVVINAITFSADGDMYVGTNLASPIIRVKASSETEPLYFGLLSGRVDQFVWGAGEYLYTLTNSKQTKAEGGLIYKIYMAKTGAPDYGRP